MSISDQPIRRRDSLKNAHCWAYGMGHFLNDLCAAMWFNFLLYYLTDINIVDERNPGYYAGYFYF